MSDNKKSKVVNLRNMPIDVEEYLLTVQGKEKVNCRCTRSKEFTIYLIIREHREMTNLKNLKK